MWARLQCMSASVALTFSLACQAAEGISKPLVWQCLQRYDEAFNAECRLLRSPTTEPALTPGDATVSPPASRFQPVAMRPAAELDTREPWLVPIYAVPSSPQAAQDLLRAVMCGRADACTVQYNPGVPVVARQARNPFIR